MQKRRCGEEGVGEKARREERAGQRAGAGATSKQARVRRERRRVQLRRAESSSEKGVEKQLHPARRS